MAANIRVRFRGIRAIHPSPNRQNLTTGGNTSSLEITDGELRFFVNAGFGINPAGQEWLMSRQANRAPFEAVIAFSDFMWDSTMGLAFFTPIHFKSSRIEILTAGAVPQARQAIDDAASELLTPFDGFASFPAKLQIKQVTKPMHYGSWTLRVLPMAHPLTQDAIGIWRFTHSCGVDIGIVMICNNDAKSLHDAALFLRGCKTLICAASESPMADNWDLFRTSSSDALSLALETETQELHLCQYHPEMNDLMLHQMLAKLKTSIEHIKLNRRSELKIHLGSEIEDIVPIHNTISVKAG